MFAPFIKKGLNCASVVPYASSVSASTPHANFFLKTRVQEYQSHYVENPHGAQGPFGPGERRWEKEKSRCSFWSLFLNFSFSLCGWHDNASNFLDRGVFASAMVRYCHLVVHSYMTLSIDLGPYKLQIINWLSDWVLVGECRGPPWVTSFRRRHRVTSRFPLLLMGIPEPQSW